MRTRVAILGILLLTAIAGEFRAFAQERDREAEAADVREAVVRYQIKTWYLAVDSYCISVNRRSARKDFLARFASLPVKPASACIEAARRGRGRMRMPTWVTDKQTDQPAVIFDVGAVRWLSNDAAEVKGGYYCAFRCWANGTYQVVREGSSWIVADFDIKAISSPAGE